MGQIALPYFTGDESYRDRHRRRDRFSLGLGRRRPGHLEMSASVVLSQLVDRRRLAIVPAFNEEGSVGRVIDEIRAFDPGFEIVVVDDGSSDRTSEIALVRGVYVATLPFNLGIGRGPN
jgi:hypothetical protein